MTYSRILASNSTHTYVNNVGKCVKKKPEEFFVWKECVVARGIVYDLHNYEIYVYVCDLCIQSLSKKEKQHEYYNNAFKEVLCSE